MYNNENCYGNCQCCVNKYNCGKYMIVLLEKLNKEGNNYIYNFLSEKEKNIIDANNGNTLSIISVISEQDEKIRQINQTLNNIEKELVNIKEKNQNKSIQQVNQEDVEIIENYNIEQQNTDEKGISVIEKDFPVLKEKKTLFGKKWVQEK